MRSGTSMMMEALEAGGLKAVYSRERDKRLNDRWGELNEEVQYLPNERYFELSTDDYLSPKFPKAYEGKLIKCLVGGVLRLPPISQYKIIFMRREQSEIVRSLAAFFGNVESAAESVSFNAQLDTAIDILRDRRSVVSLHEIWYEDVLTDPLSVFSSLDWPIDIEKAAAIPQTSKKRSTV